MMTSVSPRVGMRVEAVASFGDNLGDEPGFCIEQGDQGVLMPIYRGDFSPRSFDDLGVIWDKYPGAVHGVDQEDVRII